MVKSKKQRTNAICQRIMSANSKMCGAKGKVFEHYRGIIVGAAIELALETFDHRQWEADREKRAAEKVIPS